MKRFFTAFFAILLISAAAVGGLCFMHVNAPVVIAEAPIIEAAGAACLPSSGHAVTKTLWGYGEKETYIEGNDADLGLVPGRGFDIAFSSSAADTVNGPLTSDTDFETAKAGSPSYCRISLEKDGKTLLDGADPESYGLFEYSENGDYDLTVDLGYEPSEGLDETDYHYHISFTLRPEPSAQISSAEAPQGGIVTLKLDPAFYTEEPEISTELGSAIFISQSDGSWLSVIPVWYAQEPGDYPVDVTLGDWSFSETVTVTRTEYGRQDLTIASSTVASTRGAAGANEDYAEKIKPTYEMADPVQYWDGPFIRPVEGRITTQFGLYRYTNGSKTPTRHTGIDLAIAKGTPVPASNSGRVLFAGPVIISGNTVVIEHGGGLKTYYMHLDTVDVSAGDMVTKGDIIGTVGTTGYSTGPHLHFEVKIGSMSLDPWSLFDGTSGLYTFDSTMEEKQ